MAFLINRLAAYFLGLLNLVFSLSAIITNLLVILAIVKTPTLHTPSNVLLCSLALSDFGVGLVQSVFSISLFTGLYIRPFTDFACFVLLGASFLTLTWISVDRYLALLLHLRYRAVVTVRRVSILTCLLWILSLLGQPLVHVVSFKIYNVLIVLTIFLCLFTSTYCYVQIHRIVRRHRRQIRDQALSYPSVPTARQGKSIKTMYYIHGLFVLCVLPYPIGIGFFIHFGPRPQTLVLMSCVLSVLFLNSSINPYLYCWRMMEIRRVIIALLRPLRIRVNSGCSMVFNASRNCLVSKDC